MTPIPHDVVCVLGMHRSGTSAVARILGLIGVDLGPDERLFGPRTDNPDGFMEHVGLVELNDEILARLGGNWHEPPAFPPGWERSPMLSDLRERAARVLREDFSERTLWGWKDPRACLTLPFWRTLMPPTRYVISVRNPLSVARSLELRDGFPVDKSGRLWLDYMISALTHTAGEPRLVVAYEDLMTAWEPEVRRIARFLGRPDAASGVTDQAIRAALRPDLQHHRATLQETLAERALSSSVRVLYAGFVVTLAQRRDGASGADATDSAVTALTEAVVEEPASERLEAERQLLLADRRHLRAVQERLRADVEDLRTDLARHREALNGLETHPLWRAYRWLRFLLVPHGSRREVAYVRARRWLGARDRTGH